jgi:hypothetical protein
MQLDAHTCPLFLDRMECTWYADMHVCSVDAALTTLDAS